MIYHTYYLFVMMVNTDSGHPSVISGVFPSSIRLWPDREIGKTWEDHKYKRLSFFFFLEFPTRSD